MNCIFFDGNLKEKPELHQDRQGEQWCQITVANNRYSATEERSVNWYTVFVRGKKAVNLCKYCDKGSKIMVKGSQKLEWITGNDGVKKLSVTVNAEDVVYLFTGENNGGSRPNLQPMNDNSPSPFDSKPKQQGFDDLDNDIPF